MVMTGEEFMRAFDGVRCCFWFGLAPCPKCGQDHGDPKCTPEDDRALRDRLAAIRAAQPKDGA